MSKKIQTILSLIEVAETNLKNAKEMLFSLSEEKGIKIEAEAIRTTPGNKSKEEDDALDVVEGYFDGENMIGDNGQLYPVPQNYASKTQLIVGDRMKWMMTANREIFKLIQPANRKRTTGTFAMEGDNYVVLINDLSTPVKILKASATYAMKNLGLDFGDEVAIYIPTDATPRWGAFINVVKGGESVGDDQTSTAGNKIEASVDELDDLKEFKIAESENTAASEADFF